MAARTGLFRQAPYVWLGVLGLLWGANFLFMKQAAGLGSSQIVWLRLFFGALALLPFLPAGLRAVARERRLWLHVLIMSLAANVVTFHCFMEGAGRLGAGLAGVVSGAIPLMTALLAAVVLPGERLGRTRLAGLAVSFVGIVVIMAPWGGLAGASLAGAAYMLVGAMGYAVAFVYARRFLAVGSVSPLSLAALQMAAAVALYAPFATWSGMSRLADDWALAASVAVGLGVLGSGAAYVIYYGLIEAIGAVAASSVTYLPPLVALFLGAVFLDEPVRAAQLAGAGLVLGGIFVLRRGG